MRVQVAVLVIGFSASVAGAQSPSTAVPAGEAPVSVGARVAVTGPWGENRKAGRVEAVDGGQFTMRLDGDGSVVVPMSSVSRLEVSDGRSRPVLKYAFTGLLAGAAGGALLGAATYQEDEGAWCIVVCSRAGAAGFGAAITGVTGAFVGGVIAALNPRDQWRDVSRPVALSVGPRGVGVAISTASLF